MKAKRSHRITLALLLLAALPPAAGAKAQAVRRLRLVRGAAAAAGVLRPGTVRARHLYAFDAKAGQKLTVRLTSDRVSLGEAREAGAVFHVTDEEGRLPPDFGDYPYGGPTEWTGALPRDGSYRIVVFMEDGPDDPDAATLRRRGLSLRYRLNVTLR